jgi:plastocyanin
MTRVHTLSLALLVAGGVMLACFSDRSTGSSINTAVECRVPVATIDSTHFLVAIYNFAFHPDSITVPAGASVTWVNCEPVGTEPHTTTSDSAVWNSPILQPGSRFSHTFAAAGGFPYHCTPHPFMTAKVVVQ